MNPSLAEAVKILHDENCRCVLITDKAHTSSDLGIKPLMSFLRKNRRAFENGVIADRVIGKAAAMLMIDGGAKAAYGEIISQSAADCFKAHNIYFEYGETVPYIKNRTGDGMCPMEQTVKGLENPGDAFDALEKTIAVLMKNKG